MARKKLRKSQQADLEQLWLGGALQGALSGAGTGAAVGTAVPGIGNLFGTVAGGVMGAISGGLAEHRANKASEVPPTPPPINNVQPQMTYTPTFKYGGNMKKRYQGGGDITKQLRSLSTMPQGLDGVAQQPSTELMTTPGRGTKLGVVPNRGGTKRKPYRPRMQYGGELGEDNGQFIDYNVGQSHAGPDEGIPVDAQGQPSAISGGEPVALTEKGEVTYNGYVFSDTTKLPGNKKRTFSDEAKRIKNKYKFYLGDKLDKKDNISQTAIARELEKLMMLQETIKGNTIRKEDAEAMMAEQQAMMQQQMQQPQQGGSPEEQAMMEEQMMMEQQGMQPPMMRRGGKLPKYNVGGGGNSIVDYLSGLGQASDFSSRQQLATQFGIQGYRGTADQNMQLLELLRNQQTAPQEAVASQGFSGPNYTRTPSASAFGIAGAPHTGTEMTGLLGPNYGGNLYDVPGQSPIQQPTTYGMDMSQNVPPPEIAAAEPGPNDGWELDSGDISPWAMAPAIAGNLIGLETNKRPENIRLGRMVPEQINLEAQRVAARNRAAGARATTARRLRDTGLTPGAYLGNIQTAGSDIERNLGEQVGQSHLAEQTTNMQARQQAQAANLQIGAQETMMNTQRRDMHRQQQLGYLGNIMNVPGQFLSDQQSSRRYMSALGAMGDYGQFIQPSQYGTYDPRRLTESRRRSVRPHNPSSVTG